MAWDSKANLRGPAGYNATGAAQDDAAVAAFIKSPVGATETSKAIDEKSAALAADPSTKLGAVLAAAIGQSLNADKYRIGAEAAVGMGIVPRPLMDTPPLRFFGKYSGASVVTVAAGGAGYVVGDEITLAGGTFAAPTVLKVTSLSGGSVLGATVLVRGLYSVKPTDPVAQASTTGTGTGGAFNITWTATGSATRDRIFYTPTSGTIRFTGNGPANINNSGLYGNASGNGTASLWEWESDAPRLEVVLGGLNTYATVYVDGQRMDIAELRTDTSGANYVYTLNFDGAPRMRSFRMFAVNSAFLGIATSAGNVVRSPQQAKKLAFGLGDSYMFGNGADNLSMASFNIMCEQLGIEGLPDGVGGGGWVTSTAGTPQVRVTNKFLTLTRNPAYVFLDMGYNDRNQSAATIATNFNATVAAIQAKTPTAKIIVFGPATPQGITPALTAVRDTLTARCLALSLPFIDQMGWLNMDNEALYVGTDNEHPTQLGHSYLGVLKAEHVRPYL